MIFKPRSKSNKNCIKDTAKNKKKKKTKTEKDSEDPKILDERENKSRDEMMNATNVEAAREMNERCEEDRKIDEGIEISVETIKKKGEGAATRDNGAESVTGDEGEERMCGEGSKDNGEPVGNGEIQEEIFATVETQCATKEKEDQDVAEVKAVIENGIETDEEGDENMTKCTRAEPADEGAIAKEAVAEPQAADQIPDESQE